jgi:hypothetical protein
MAKENSYLSRHSLKYVALFLVAAGIPTIILDSSAGSEIPLLVGLFMLMISRNKIEDERSIQIRATSFYISFIASYGCTLLLSNLFDNGILPFRLSEINHFLILTLVITNALFYTRLHFLKY